MESSTGFHIFLLALAGMFLHSKGEPDTWKAQSVKMNETWPFMVFSSTVLEQRTETCDAMIYKEKWLLMSPTCPSRKATMFYFGVGNKWCDSGNYFFPYAKDIQIRKLKRHILAPKYRSLPWWVVRLVEVLPITFNKNVQPAKLAEELPLEGQKFDSPGWVGIKDETGCHERYKTLVTIESEAKCNETWARKGIDTRQRGHITCFMPLRDRSTYNEFINNGAPLVKNGTVYGFVTEYINFPTKAEYVYGLPISPYILWLQYITNEHWYPILSKLLTDILKCY